MKKYFLSALILGSALTATAAKLEHSDFVGRVMIVNQADSNLMISMEIAAGLATRSDAKINGTVKGKQLDCAGRSEMVEGTRTLLLSLKCQDGQSARVLLNTEKTEVASYLQGGLATANISIILQKGTARAKMIFGGEVDIKKLN